MHYQAPTQIAHLKRYLKLFFSRERKGWLKILRFYNVYIPLGIVCIIGLAIYINPLPPTTAYLAVGQDGSSYQEISKNFKTFFNKNNVDLELISTSGLGEGLKGLHDVKSKINASFLTVGFACLATSATAVTTTPCATGCSYKSFKISVVRLSGMKW